MAPWHNWTGDRRASPEAIDRPRSEDELCACVRRAAVQGQGVRAAGSGHSFGDLVPCAGRIVDLRHMDRVLHVDRARRRVTVEAGITLRRLSRALDLVDLALPSLGDIDAQTVAGAIATGTHGTGARHRGIASQVTALRLVGADGEAVEARLEADDPASRERAHVARVALGALGIVSRVELQCVPAFRLRAVEAPERIDALLEDLDAHVDAHDHFELFWVPHTGWALTKRNDRTDEPEAPRPLARRLRDDVLYGNVLFGAAARLGAARPDWIPRLQRALPGTGRREYVEPGWRVFPSPRWVRFHEMEYAVPRPAATDVLRAVRDWVRRSGQRILFPVEVRFGAADDVPLSPAFGRDTAWVACHVARGRPFDEYFGALESVAADVGGRPHWGKLHGRRAADLAPVYPEWARFQAVRKELDPGGRFTNAHVARVLGPAA